MAKNIEPTLKLISRYLKLDKNESFIIPEYQRGYSWDIVQCDKLWQDIEAFISSGASDPYFFGTIIVDCSHSPEYSLIDGQQRTTTFLLLLKALLLNINIAINKIPKGEEDSESLEAGLKANRDKIMAILYKAEPEEIPMMLKDNSKLQDILLIQNESINELYKDELKKIIEAVDYFTAEQKVFKVTRKHKKNKYTNHFRNFDFFYEQISKKSDSQINNLAKVFLEKCQVIEIRSWQIEQAITMFNSLNSTGMPLSDADIISAQMYSKAGEGQKDFNNLWLEIISSADKLNNRKIVNIDAILQQYMYIVRAKNKEYLKDTSVDVTTPGLRRYYTDINKKLLDDPINTCNNLKKIATIWDAIKDYPIVKLLLKFNENAKIYLSSYLFRIEATEINDSIVTEISECLLRLFAILELVDVGYSSTKFKTFLFGVNLKLVDSSVPIDIIRKEFDDHIIKNWEKSELSGAISGYDKNLLVYLNEYLFHKQKKLEFDFSDTVNIEHIMPSSGKNLVSIRKDAKIEDVEEFESIVNKLGNKILLEEDINKSIGNEWFKTKKQNSINDKLGYKNSRYGIALSLTGFHKDKWEKEDIEFATEIATDRIIAFIFQVN